MLTNQIAACKVTRAISSESNTVIGAFTLNGRATVVDKRGLCTASWVPVHELVHAKCCKNSQRCVLSIKLILETE